MAQSEEHYRAAAHSLGEGFLGSKFGQSNLDQAEVSKIHRIEAFKENAILLAGDHVENMGVMALGAQAAKTNMAAQEKRAKDAKRTTDTILFLDLLDRHIADLDRRMGELGELLVEQFGEQWSEQVALEILDPDEMPQRQDNESIADYQARVDNALVQELLNDDGSIKPEYKDHPRYGNAAQFMQYRFDKGAAVELRTKLSDPDLTPEEAQNIIRESEGTPTMDRLQKAQDGLSNEVGVQALVDEVENQIDEKGVSQPATSEDMAFLGSP